MAVRAPVWEDFLPLALYQAGFCLFVAESEHILFSLMDCPQSRSLLFSLRIYTHLHIREASPVWSPNPHFIFTSRNCSRLRLHHFCHQSFRVASCLLLSADYIAVIAVTMASIMNTVMWVNPWWAWLHSEGLSWSLAEAACSWPSCITSSCASLCLVIFTSFSCHSFLLLSFLSSLSFCVYKCVWVSACVHLCVMHMCVWCICISVCVNMCFCGFVHKSMCCVYLCVWYGCMWCACICVWCMCLCVCVYGGVCCGCLCVQARRSHRLISVAFPRSCPPRGFRQSHWDLVLPVNLGCLVGEPQGFTVPDINLGLQACAATLDIFFFLRLQYNYISPCPSSSLPNHPVLLSHLLSALFQTHDLMAFLHGFWGRIQVVILLQ